MQPVTRMELLDHVEGAFTTVPATRGDLLKAAVNTEARPEVLAVLRRLPDVQFRRAHDLWEELGDVPISSR